MALVSNAAMISNAVDILNKKGVDVNERKQKECKKHGKI